MTMMVVVITMPLSLRCRRHHRSQCCEEYKREKKLLHGGLSPVRFALRRPKEIVQSAAHFI
jgi:hypothetical protein